MKEVLALSGVQQASLIRKGEITSLELVSAHLARIEQVNPALNAAVEVMAERALAAAKQIAPGDPRPFAGVPFSIKDSIEVKGTVCSAGTLGYRNRPVCKRDATLVKRLRDTGGIPLARTNLPDLLFAFESDNLIFGRTNNPYDRSRSSGGSSGGEAALIAACGSPFGLGSDAAGSVRLPAHYCGIAALKPTSGRLPRTGHVPPYGGWIEALWQIGPMARRAEDLRVMMEVLDGPDGEDRTVPPIARRAPVDLKELRAGFFTDNRVIAADPDTDAVVRNAAAALQGCVRSVEEFVPPAVKDSYELEMKFLGPDGGDGLRNFLKDIGSHRTHPLLDGWLNKLEAYRTGIAGFGGYWAELDRFRESMFEVLSRFDVLLSPVAAFPAVPHGSSIENMVFPGYSYTMTHNLTGWPAATVRCGTSKGGLPIGVQVAAGPWNEDVVLDLTAALEVQLGGWRDFESR